MSEIPRLQNVIAVGPGAARSATNGRNCVVVGVDALGDEPDLGCNLFHIEGLCSVRIQDAWWPEAVAEAREAHHFGGLPEAIAHLAELAGVDPDAVRREVASTLWALMRASARMER
jgi:hypothetical protein